MARYGKEHKEATRRRILEKAGRRFKQNGIDGSGIATLMSDAGLTNGAFYAHFSSKDDLVASVVADQLSTQAVSFGRAAPGRAGLEELLQEYLSPAHRDHPGDGCPSAALLDEVARCGEQTKRAYAQGAQAILREIAGRLAPDDPESARGRAVHLYSMLVGTLQLSRAVGDPALSDEVLQTGLANALALVEDERPTRPRSGRSR